MGLVVNMLELACVDELFVADPDGLPNPKRPPLDCARLPKGLDVAAEDGA